MLTDPRLPEAWGATSHRVDLGPAVGAIHYVDFGGPRQAAPRPADTAAPGPTDTAAPGGTGTEEPAPIVLVHGLGGSYVNWVALGPRLAASRRVFALDLPGFGRSEPLRRSTRVRANAHALAAFIQQVVLAEAGASKPLIIGNSMGGMLAIMYASTHPVTGAVLTNPVLPRVAGQPFDREIAAAFAAYAVPGIGPRLLARERARNTPEQTVREVLGRACADLSTVPPDLLAASIELVGDRAATPGIDRAFLQAARSLLMLGARARTYRAMMAAIDAPVLLVHGSLDRLVPVQAARAAAMAFPKWTYVELPHAGHVPHMEAAEDTYSVIDEWVGANRVG